MDNQPKLLTIAGSDSGGGAGIQADIKTFSALGGYGMSALTALTAQNTLGVSAILPVPVDFIEKQIDAIFSDFGVDALKTGMLYSSEVIETVAKKCREYKVQNLVIDPVMVATSGDVLLQNSAIESFKTILFPLSTLITPNLPEAEILLQAKIETIEDMIRLAPDLLQWGGKAVLLKGGHLEGEECVDILYIKEGNQLHIWESPKIDTENTHGTGCTLSAAIVAFLGKKYDLREAVEEARAYLYQAILAGKNMKLGKGKGPVKHFWRE
jgi:hydroxymethylpyrimidine/phosphomethylpyrimidine kinase